MERLSHYKDVVLDALRFYKNLIVERSVGGYVALGALAFVVLVVAIFVIIGYQRGGSRETMRLLFAGVALVAAFFATALIGRAGFFDRSISSIIPLQKATLMPLFEASFAVILLPVVFVFAFLIFNLILGIPYQLLCGILGYTYRRNNAFTRCIGIFVGMLHGLLISVLLLLPFFSLVRPYAAIVKKPEPDQKAAVAFYDHYLEETAESPLYRYTMRLGGDKLLREIEEGNLADLFLKKDAE